MKIKFLITAALGMLLALSASPRAFAEDDSMANFKSLVQNFKPSAADMGGMVAPEIYSAINYPRIPQPGQKVVVKALIRSYTSMVGYKISDVNLLLHRNANSAGVMIRMKSEDAENGIYSAEIGPFEEGDQIVYSVVAVDDWGNQAVEIPLNENYTAHNSDTADSAIDPSLDINDFYARLNADGDMQLCMELAEKPKRLVGNDIAAYGILIFGRDVRYKPEQTETEFTNGFMAAYIPNFSVKDLVPTNQLMEVLNPNKKKEKRGKFDIKGNNICASFSPDVIREDYQLGVKVVGATIAFGTSPMVAKPVDTTRTLMIYPGAHSFKVYKVN